MATGGLYGNSGTGALIAQPGTETPGLYGKSPNGSVVAQPGSESTGLYGNGTTFGGSYFEWFVFQTSATQPATPTGGSWSFQTDSGTPPSGWTNAPASNPTNPVWISIALVNSKSTSALVWSTPGVLSYSGTINGSGAPTSSVGQIGELYIQTGVTPNALWFKSDSTTWTQITGSALYVDLVSSQTIAGTKTFSSTIQGSISGNAETVTNGVYTNGTYVNPAWITSLAGSKIIGDISGNATNVTGNVAIVNGGTGATTASGARTNLGLGTIATQNASSVAITGGSITGITDLAIADGGTGASTAGQARTNLGLGTAAVLDAGVANGVATLDSGGTVPLSQIPASIQGGVSYQGAWNASTNSPTLTSGVGTKGYYYVVSVAGSTNLNGVTDWNIGDWAIFNGTIWQKIDNTDAVTSVNGYTGTVVLTASDIGGLGTMAVQNANAIAITGGTESGVTHSGDTIGTYLDYTGTSAPSYVEGRTWYDSNRHALAYYNDSSNDVVHIGQDLIVKVINNTGSTIPNGSPVYITSTSSGQTYPNIALAKADVAATASVIGLTNGAIANGAIGYVTAQGGIDNVNTGTFTVGQVLYLSPYSAGQLMNTIPPTGITVQVGVVQYVNSSTGIIYVKQTTPLSVPASIITGQVAIANGGTGQSTANAAFNALAPSQTGNSGKYLTTDGSNTSWATNPLGTVTSVDASGGTTGLSFTGGPITTSGTVTLGGTLAVGSGGTGSGTASGARTNLGLGTIATQDASNVAITGGTIDNTVIGGTTPAAGTFTTLTANSTSQFGKGSANYLQAVGGATTVSPVFSVLGTDTNIDLSLTTKGTGSHRFNSGTALAFIVNSQPSNVNYGAFTSTATATSPLLQVAGSDTNVDFRFRTQGTGAYQFDTGSNANTQLKLTHTASAVNNVQVTGGATGSAPSVIAAGSDSAVNLALSSKSTGSLNFYTNSANINSNHLNITHTGSVVNRFQLTGAQTGFGVTLSVNGSDPSISQVFQSKGTGAIDLAAGSSGVNISNGGTVTAYTRTNPGTNLWLGTIPTVTVSAPTTAGGVQAVLAVQGYVSSATIQSGGTGYTVGDTLTMVGGTGGPATFTVSTVSAGVITAVTALNFGQYSVAPTNPVSVTGGTGSSATLNVSYGLGTLYSITNAGSGYVEQPTLTISGQTSGSGAAAYATVGGTTTFKTIGGLQLFNTPAGTQFSIADSGGATPTAWWGALGSTTVADFRTQGASITAGALTTQSAIPLLFRTNYTEQFRVAHTASAVNYVQVTGAATGGFPTISTQGSDASVALWLTTKGTSATRFLSQNGSYTQLRIDGSVASANSLNVIGGASGFGAVLSVQGADANIPLVLQPLGTGALQAQQTDSTATGGNARGANAVDWQTIRSAASNVASANYSVISGGNGNTNTGSYGSLVGGLNNTASGLGSFIGSGQGVTAARDYSVGVGGISNNSNGYFNFIGGGQANSGTANAAVTTQSATMNGTTAVTLAASNANIKVGQVIQGTSIANYTYVAAISGTSLTLSQAASGSSTSTLSFYTPHGVVVGGGNNQATGSYSFIGGGGDAGTASNRNSASGDWATVAGGRGNIASGAGAFVGGGGFDGTNTLANTASGIGATVVGGAQNTAVGLYATTGGRNNYADGNRSTVFGNAGSSRTIRGYYVFAACQDPIGGVGASQGALLIVGKQTTDATPTVLTSNGGAAGTDNQIILPNSSAYYFTGEVVAGVTSGGNTKGWTISGLIKRGANAAATTLVGSTVTSLYADAGAATWTIALSADTTNGGLAVTFTGQASTTIRTVAQIRTTEMTY